MNILVDLIYKIISNNVILYFIPFLCTFSNIHMRSTYKCFSIRKHYIHIVSAIIENKQTQFEKLFFMINENKLTIYLKAINIIFISHT